MESITEIHSGQSIEDTCGCPVPLDTSKRQLLHIKPGKTAGVGILKSRNDYIFSVPVSSRYESEAAPVKSHQYGFLKRLDEWQPHLKNNGFWESQNHYSPGTSSLICEQEKQ